MTLELIGLDEVLLTKQGNYTAILLLCGSVGFECFNGNGKCGRELVITR